MGFKKQCDSMSLLGTIPSTLVFVALLASILIIALFLREVGGRVGNLSVNIRSAEAVWVSVWCLWLQESRETSLSPYVYQLPAKP